MEWDKKKFTVPGIREIPKPRPGAGGGGLALLALLALLSVGLVAFWLTREPETKLKWREDAAAVIDNATSGTPLARVGDLLRDAPQPPPPAVTAPHTAPGTLAGQNVQGTVEAPVEGGQWADAARQTSSGQTTTGGSSPAGAQPGAQAARAQDGSLGLLPKVTADSRVRPDFIDDLAAYLVARYRTGANGGSLAVSVQGINHRYASRVNGMAQGGRAGLLRYAFQPTMLNGLYSLYVDRFMAALARESGARNLSAEQNRQLHMALAGRLVILASGLEGIAGAATDVKDLLRKLEQRSNTATEINSQMMTAVFDLDQLREDKAPESQISAAQMRVDGLNARYRRALDERQAAQRALVATVRKGGGQAMDDESLLFLISWLERRSREGADVMPSVQSMSRILRDLSSRCAQVGEKKEAPAGGAQPPAQPLATGQGS